MLDYRSCQSHRVVMNVIARFICVITDVREAWRHFVDVVCIYACVFIYVRILAVWFSSVRPRKYTWINFISSLFLSPSLPPYYRNHNHVCPSTYVGRNDLDVMRIQMMHIRMCMLPELFSSLTNEFHYVFITLYFRQTQY